MIEAADVPAAIAAHAPRAGVFLDLDGTLAPIVPRPELSEVLPEIPSVLARLAGRLDVVAVISGRPSEQVRGLLDVDGVQIVGTHGLEDERPMAEEILDEVRAAAAAVGRLGRAEGRRRRRPLPRAFGPRGRRDRDGGPPGRDRRDPRSRGRAREADPRAGTRGTCRARAGRWSGSSAIGELTAVAVRRR